MDKKVTLKSITDLMQPFLGGKASSAGATSESDLPDCFTIEDWKVTLMNTIKYLKKIEYVKPVMKLSPPTQQEKRSFLMSQTFKDEGPVHLAVKSECEAILKLLLKQGANPNAYEIHSDGSKILPMKYAIQNENETAVKILLEHRALSMKAVMCTNDGVKKTPLTYVRELEPTCADSKKMKSIIKLLRDAQSKKDNLSSGNLSTSMSALETTTQSQTGSTTTSPSRLSTSASLSRPQEPAPSAPPAPPPLPPVIRPKNVPPARPPVPNRRPPLVPNSSSLATGAKSSSTSNTTRPKNISKIATTSAAGTDSLAAKQKELETALNLQEQLDKAEIELKETVEEIKRREKELYDIRRRKVKANQDINRVKKTHGYKDRDSIAALTQEITVLSAAAEAKKETSTAADTNKEMATSCPVCFNVPKEIYECQKCHNMTCGECVGNLPQCPLCRQDFKDKPPVRNLLAERIVNSV